VDKCFEGGSCGDGIVRYYIDYYYGKTSLKELDTNLGQRQRRLDVRVSDVFISTVYFLGTGMEATYHPSCYDLGTSS
jgi:hypothetical protein